jgi:putative copper resistance protein D
VIPAAVVVVARFAHYLGASVLFGAALFPYYGFASSPLDMRREPSWLRLLLLASALLTVLSGAGWYVLDSAPQAGAVVSLLWVARLVIGAAVGGILLLSRTPGRNRFVLAGAFFLLATFPWIGKADAGGVAAPVHVIHLVAAAVWVGALAVFAGLLGQSSRDFDDGRLRVVHNALKHFSGTGTAVVAALILTGIILLAVEGTSGFYTLVLAAKLVFFAAMLCLAAANRYWLTPRLSVAIDAERNLRQAVAALRISLLVETLLAALVLAAVALLGTV